MTASDRLRQARQAAGFKTVGEAAESLGLSAGTYGGHEAGTRKYDDDRAQHYARRFGVDAAWLLFGTGKGVGDRAETSAAETPSTLPPSNATIQSELPQFDYNETLPIYGQAIGGIDGEFIFNGQKIDDVLAPPSLRGVRNAYAVEFSGESMEPRYFAGEIGFIDPRRAVRAGDFVVAQIASGDGDPPLAYVKRFVRMTADTLTLTQFNPAKELTFDRALVVSVHKIVGTG